MKRAGKSLPNRILVIQNRQRVRPIDLPLLRRILQSALADHLRVPAHELGLHLIDAGEMADLNQTYLQHEGSTDVITFDHSDPSPTADAPAATPAGALHGEIFISVPDAIAQAREFGTQWPTELVRYAIHGLLHLLGHDDLEPQARRRMKRVENRLVKAIAQEHPLARLERRAQRVRPKRVRS